MTKLELEDELKRLKIETSNVLKKITSRNETREIVCSCCGIYHKIRNLVVIQCHWYSTEGELRFICPETEIANRLLFTGISWRKRDIYRNNARKQFKRIYKNLFKEIVDQYEDEFTLKHQLYDNSWINNHYPDDNRGLFGLTEKEIKDEDH